MPSQPLFAIGFLVGDGGDGSTGGGMNRISADARRLFDPGLSSRFGLHMRNGGDAAARYDETGRGLSSVTKRELWERVFVRLRKAPTSGSPDPVVWSLRGNIEGTPALFFRINGTTLSLYNQGNATAPGSLLSSAALTLGVWHCLEIHVRFNNAPFVSPDPPYENNALVSWKLDGSIINTHDRDGVNPQFGIDRRDQQAVESKLGDSTNAGKGLEIDYSDWIADGGDWVGQERRVAALWVTGAGAHTEWTGGNSDYRHQLDFPFPTTSILLGVSTQTGNARQTYAVESPESKGITGDMYSARIAVHFSAVGGSGLKLIVRRNGSDTEYDIGSPPQGAWSTWRIDASDWQPDDSLQVGVRNTASPQAVTRIGACLLLIEHDTSGTPEEDQDATFRVIQTTYTGNGTQQSIGLASIDPALASQMPAVILVMPESGNAPGAWWWGSKVFASVCNNAAAVPEAIIPRPGMIHLTGSSGSVNQNGIAYRLTACFDPKSRIVERGAVALPSGSDDRMVHLRDVEFTPEAIFIVREQAPTNDSTKSFFRGHGFSGDQTISLSGDAAPVSGALQSIGSGEFEVGTLVNEVTQDFAFMAWRTSEFISNRLVAVTSYLGNGVNPRSVSLALDGATPVFVSCVPVAAGSRWLRVGGVTRQWNGSTSGAANAITGLASDSVVVGSDLNANGVTYSVFALAVGMDHEVELRQLNFPTSTGSTDLGPATNRVLKESTIAYITGAALMPQLRARVPSPGGATAIDWSLEITSERPERGTRDNVQTSPVELASNQAWAIDDALDMFVGGNCIVHYRGKNAGGYLWPARTFAFKLRGKNPLDATAKDYIEDIQGSQRFLWAMVQHESRQDLRVYNQFNASGSSAELPNWGDPDGWGFGQVENATTAQTYDWKANSQRALAILNEKQQAQQRFFDAVARTYPNDPDAQTPPSSYTPPGTSTAMTAMEAGTVTLYNGAGGCPISALVDSDGVTKNFQNPWKFDPNPPSGQPKWTFTPNSNNYLYKVIYDEFEAHASIQE